jgi:hypothetical protein
MIDQTQHARRLPPLDMPSQSAIVRAGSSGAARPGGGVEADGLFDDIVSGIGKVASVAGPVLGGLGLLP